MGNRSSREAAPPGAGATAAAAAAEPSTSGREAAAAVSECPVPERYRNAAVYNVYNQRINDPAAGPGAPSPLARLPEGFNILDPRNNMPLEANQQPAPGQKRLLSTDRIQSNIPKGGTAATWVYPSPQMFYNALVRKNKAEGVGEEDMDHVVHAHNTLNELTWQQVRAWELLHRAECGESRLLRFLGRPHDLSPLARMRTWAGGPAPFDRHDWYVDRCGREVRYVIDFYFDDTRAGAPEAFDVTVRPALDSVGAALDRAKMFIYTHFAEWGLPCPVTGHPGTFAAGPQGGAAGAAAGGDTTAG